MKLLRSKLAFSIAFPLTVITSTVFGQTEIPLPCFNTMHEAAYTPNTSLDKLRASVKRFEAEGCAKYLETAFISTNGIPPKGVISATASLALAYESAKRRSEGVQTPSTPNSVVAFSPTGGRVNLSVGVDLPPNLRSNPGGTATFRPSNSLNNQLIEELRGSGVVTIRRP